MSTDEKLFLLKITAFFAGFIFIVLFLGIVWAREQVKKDLRRQGFAPINVRWRPFAYWSWSEESSFFVTFVDATGCIQTGRCSGWFSKVRWISNDTKYLDKKMPRAGRLIYLIFAILLVAFGLKNLVTGELTLPPSLRRPAKPIYLHGWPVILASFAALCCAASLTTAIVYCYHLRANERNYIFVSRGFSVLSWILLWLSFGVYFYQ